MNNIKYKFFWKGFNPFSNWYKCLFRHNDIIFNCAEQAMMYRKAILFNDTKIANEVLNTKDPKDHKALGRRIKNFDSKIWDDNKYNIVKEILLDKFTQNKDLKIVLVKYKDYIIVEASPYDRIWGIGYTEEDALNNIDKWGENLLGKILTELAQKLK